VSTDYQTRPAPPWLDDEAALLLIDWSWWLNKSWALFGVDMVSHVVGTLTRNVLSHRPAHVALCLDAPGATWRHDLRHPKDEAWRYKGSRPPKPDDFYSLAERCTQIAELHAIPILWADRREADDVIATATAKARAAGYRVWICSHDKDLCQLVDDTKETGIVVGTWDNFEGSFRGPGEVRAHFGVEPWQMADYLAIAGDTGDSVPGVRGLGGKAAAEILGAWGTLESALSAEPYTPEAHAAAERHAAALAKRIRVTSDAAKREELEKERAEVMRVRRLARAHGALVAAADVARFSRQLTALDCDAPISIPWEELPCGGFHADELRDRLRAIGFSRLALEVPAYRKRAPWKLPWETAA
jgi:DNA polymerase-1